MKIVGFFIFTLLLSVQTHAGVLLDLNGTYMTDTLKSTTTNSSSEYFYNLGVLFTLNKNFWGGWNYMGVNSTEKAAGVTTTLSTSDTGPYVKWLFGKGQMFSMSAAYNILAKGTYKNGTNTSESWQGTSYWVSFGLMPEVKNNLHIGVSLNYYAASFTKKTVSGTESSASNSKTWVFPSLSLTKSW